MIPPKNFKLDLSLEIPQASPPSTGTYAYHCYYGKKTDGEKSGCLKPEKRVYGKNKKTESEDGMNFEA